MTTDVFDITLHNSSFPSTYIGSGTVICNPKASEPAAALSLYWAGSGNIVSIALGDEPLRIDIVDTTTNIVWTWMRGMAATKCLKQVAAGTQTVDTSSAIVVTATDGTKGIYTVALSAALNVSAAALVATVLL